MASDSNPELGLTAQPSVTRAISHIRIFPLRLIRNNTTTNTPRLSEAANTTRLAAQELQVAERKGLPEICGNRKALQEPEAFQLHICGKSSDPRK